MKPAAASYTLEPATGVRVRDGFAGIAYADGGEQRILDLLLAAKDLSTGSEELAGAIRSWPDEAHLSPARANLLRPFRIAPGATVLELGAGCGALTRYLGECGAVVHALEGAYVRARCAAARTRDLPNVSVYYDDLSCFEPPALYDLVTLVGVLEYSRLFLPGDDPVHACLGRARSLLKPGGVLVLAIENQLGLKYLNGCHEDHLGARFTGVTDLYGPTTAVTFGKRELEWRLRRAGFSGVDWYYPFPDYKVPTVVVADRALGVEAFAVGDLLFGETARDHGGSPLRSFDEAGAWPVLRRNALLGELANSFLAVARTGPANPADPDGNWLAHKYSTARVARYATVTSFTGAGADVAVAKAHLYPQAVAGEAAPAMALEHRVGASRYVPGRLYVRAIADVIARTDAIEDIAAAFTPWLSLLLSRVRDGHDAALPWSQRRLPGELLDCVPFNLVVDEAGRLEPIDLEFVANDDIPLPWVVLRGVVHTASRCFGQRALLDLTCDELLKAVVRQLGLGDVADWTPYCELEDRLILTVLLPWPGRKSEGLLLERLRTPASTTISAYHRLERLERRLVEARERVTALAAEGEEARVAQGRSTASIAQLQARASELERELGRAQAALATQRQDATEALAARELRIAALSAQEAELRAAYDAHAASATRELAGLRATHEAHVATLTRELTEARAAQQTEVAALTRELASARAAHEAQIATRERELADAGATHEAQLRFLASELAAMRAARDAAQAIFLGALERERADRNHQADSHRLHAAQLERAVAAASSEATAAGELLRTLQAELVNRDDEITQLRRQLESQMSAGASAREELAAVRARLSGIEASASHRIATRVGAMRGAAARALDRIVSGSRAAAVRGASTSARALGAVRGSAGRAVEQSQRAVTWPAFAFARSVYTRLPVSPDARTRVKDVFYERFGVLFRHTQNFQMWELTRNAPPPTVSVCGPTPLAALPATTGGPSLSIVIPAFGKPGLTRSCIRRVRSAGCRVPMEIIVVDDGSPRPLAEELKSDALVRIVRLDRNSGFIEACNRGAAEAQGTHLVFLNNDAKVRAGALDAMLAAFDAHEGVGIVGCKLVFPDGRLQEAGAYIRPDGSADMVGLWDDPDKPQYGFAREVGYVSGACLMIPRALFLELGGFDPAFAPAYCEDSDLCYRVRASGRRVMYEPRAVVVHALSASMQESSIDKQQVVAANQHKFLERWSGTLEDEDRLRAIAFYLPQYHPIPENDAWWGKGFTEWTNVARARPLFAGHHQPNIPADLGFYDLRVPEVREQQADLARAAGLHGFCYYYYWFGGKRLLNGPLDAVIASGAPDFPFCVCWANENWTRRWDGLDSEVLMAQRHSPDDDIAFIESLLPAFRDPRYIRVRGRPVLLLYRPALLPDARATAERWRAHARKRGIGELYLLAVQSFFHLEGAAPDTYGFDGAVEFPPHSLAIVAPEQPQGFPGRRFEGNAYDYRQTADSFIKRVPPGYKLFRCVMPRWDNTARRRAASGVFVNGGPEAYREWLRRAADYTRRMYFGDERLLFVNAWNEWGEGNYLEPDRQYGHAYLDATRAVLRGT